MNQLSQFFAAHQVAIAFWAPIIVGCLVDSLPDPTPQSSAFYVYAFKVSHALLARFKTASNASNSDRRTADQKN